MLINIWPKNLQLMILLGVIGVQTACAQPASDVSQDVSKTQDEQAVQITEKEFQTPEPNVGGDTIMIEGPARPGLWRLSREADFGKAKLKIQLVETIGTLSELGPGSHLERLELNGRNLENTADFETLHGRIAQMSNISIDRFRCLSSGEKTCTITFDLKGTVTEPPTGYSDNIRCRVSLPSDKAIDISCPDLKKIGE